MVKVFNCKLNGEVGSSHTHTHTHTYALYHTHIVCYAIEYLDNELRTCNSSKTSLPLPKYIFYKMFNLYEHLCMQ